MLSEEESRDRLEDADENNDGKVTWAEYLSDTYGIDSSGENLSVSDENEHVRHLHSCLCNLLFFFSVTFKRYFYFFLIKINLKVVENK